MHRPGNASVRLERRVLVSPVARTERHTSMYGGTWRYCRRLALKVHVVPAQRPQLLSACAGQQRDDEIRV